MPAMVVYDDRCKELHLGVYFQSLYSNQKEIWNSSSRFPIFQGNPGL